MKTKPTILLLALFLCIPFNYAFSQWTMTANFEQGTPGTVAGGTSGFPGGFSLTYYSTAQVNSGTKSAEVHFTTGDAGWAKYGGEFVWPSTVGEGGQVWVRYYARFGTPWPSTGTPRWPKFFRAAHVLQSGGGNRGYQSFYISDGDGSIIVDNEINNNNPNHQITFPAQKIVMNQWDCWEMYIKFSANESVGKIITWKNGILIENRTQATLGSSSDYAWRTLAFSYWNDPGPTSNCLAWLDDIVITTVTPSKIDSKGNPMIGPIGGPSCGGPDPWTNTFFTQQTGTFTTDFDVIPSGTNIDGVVGLSNAAAATYTDLACIVRFNTNGNIDARNGSSYQAANTVSYLAGISYHVKMNVNLNTKKYDVYVTPQGGSQQTIASQYDFRTEQNTVTQLNNWAKNTASCSLDVKNFTSGVTTSVKDNLNNTTIQMTIYPNPASEQLIVEISSSEAQTISMLDLPGRELVKENITETQTKLDITSLTDGIYICIIMDKNGNKLGAEKISIVK